MAVRRISQYIINILYIYVVNVLHCLGLKGLNLSLVLILFYIVAIEEIHVILLFVQTQIQLMSVGMKMTWVTYSLIKYKV